MLSSQELHDAQKHLFSNVNNLDERDLSKQLFTLSAMRTETMSSFSSITAEKKLRLSSRRKFEGSIDTADFSLIGIFSAIDFSN